MLPQAAVGLSPQTGQASTRFPSVLVKVAAGPAVLRRLLPSARLPVRGGMQHSV